MLRPPVRHAPQTLPTPNPQFVAALLCKWGWVTRPLLERLRLRRGWLCGGRNLTTVGLIEAMGEASESGQVLNFTEWMAQRTGAAAGSSKL
eukprot:COSAG04_NODE_1219_length_7705_cov_3.777807_5_plen_91_part_00